MMAEESILTATSKDYVKTPLNACSLETIQTPISVSDDDDHGSNKICWPMMLGCYELDESTGQRKGRLDFYAVNVPTEETGETTTSCSSPSSSSSLRFSTSTNIFGGSDGLEDDDNLSSKDMSGVLDGKWDQPNIDGSCNSTLGLRYATAHASGSIAIHRVAQPRAGDADSIVVGDEDALPKFEVTTAARSEPPDGNNSLCLALSWDCFNPSSDTTRIISSYSDGNVAIHNVSKRGKDVQIEEYKTWVAHKLFGCPAEVWCASFTTDPNVALSGGDDCIVKLWDIRVTASPQHVLKHFDAGATVISPHPRREHMVACGSYDETMMLIDLRMVSESQPKVLCHTDPLGGGLWRMKWHPHDGDRLLLGAMHGGCRVVKINGNKYSDCPPNSYEAQVTHKFTKHESMAYGADWLVYQPPRGQTKIEAAASCSFYDRAMYLWDVD